MALFHFISQVKTYLMKNKQNNYDINKNTRFFINLHLYVTIFLNLDPDPEKHGSRKTWNIYGIKKYV